MNAAIKARITPPRLGERLVARSLVDKLLTEACRHSLILMCAPAGYGKTTLAQQYAAARAASVCWYALDEQDNDASVFARYLVASLARHVALPDEIHALLGTEQAVDARELVHGLLAELDQVQHPLILVLDDAHLIHEPAIRAALDTLILYLPDAVQVVLLSRQWPPGLQRLALSDQRIYTVDARDLAFGEADMLQFFRNHDLQLSPTAARRFSSEVQGWVAGLKLIALGHRDRDLALEPSAVHRVEIRRYLFHEIHERLPPALQDFLLATCVCERFNLPLARALTGSREVEALLDAVDRLQLFVTRTAQDDSWFRYHPLLLEFLRVRAEECGAASGLHLRAARWWQDAGQLNSAAEHYAASRDEAAVCAFLNVHGSALYNSGHAHALARCLAEMRPEAIARHLNVTRLQIWIEHIVERRRDQAENRIAAAEHWLAQQIAPEAARRQISLQFGYMRATAALDEGGEPGLRRAEALARESLLLCDECSDCTQLPAICATLSMIAVEGGRLDEALHWSIRATGLDHAYGYPVGVFWHLYQRATIVFLQGDIDAADQMLHSAMHLVRQHGLGFLPVHDFWLRLRTAILWMRLQLQEAAVTIANAYDMCERWPDEQLASCVWQCRIARANLDLASMHHLTQRLEVMLPAVRISSRVRVEVWDELLHAALLHNQSATAQRLLAQPSPPLAAASPAALAMRRNLALASAIMGREAAASDELAAIMTQAAAQGMVLENLRCSLIRAALLWRAGEQGAVFALIEPVLLWAQHQRTYMLILDYAAWLEAPLAGLHTAAPPHSALSVAAGGALQRVRQRLAALRRGQSLATSDDVNRHGLTPQEWSILQLVGQGYSNDAICDALGLAMNTVRFHIRNLNKKLGVRTRDEAIHVSLSLAKTAGAEIL